MLRKGNPVDGWLYCDKYHSVSECLWSVSVYRCIVCVVWTHITTLATMNFCTFWFEELFWIYTCHPSFNIFLFRSFYFMLKVRLVLLVLFLSFWLTQLCKYMLLKGRFYNSCLFLMCRWRIIFSLIWSLKSLFSDI